LGRRTPATIGALRSDRRVVLARAAGDDPLASAGAIAATAVLGGGVCSRGVGIDAICATVS
jgi:hypothetical protein